MAENSPKQSHMLTKVEQRGLEPVPDDQRNGTPGQLFWVWFAANISILGIPLGATLISLGLNVWQSVLVTAIGSFGSFALVGIISVAGRRGGAPSLGLSRAIFGVRGNIGPAVVALCSRLGWETVNTITGAFALLSLWAIIFKTPVTAKEAPGLVLAFILIFVVLTIIVAVAGHGFILKIQKWATWIFGALTLLVAGYLAATVDWSLVLSGKPGSLSAVLIGIGELGRGYGTLPEERRKNQLAHLVCRCRRRHSARSRYYRWRDFNRRWLRYRFCCRPSDCCARSASSLGFYAILDFRFRRSAHVQQSVRVFRRFSHAGYRHSHSTHGGSGRRRRCDHGRRALLYARFRRILWPVHHLHFATFRSARRVDRYFPCRYD